MGIFDSIKRAIFGEAKADTVAAPTPATVPGAVVPPMGTSTAPASAPAGTPAGQTTTAAGPAPMSSATQEVDVAPILDKAEEEIGELREALAAGQAAAVKEEFGDLLFAMVNLGRHLGVDAEAALAGTNEKFRSRFHRVQNAVEASGRSLGDAALEEMEALWQDAKGRRL